MSHITEDVDLELRLARFEELMDRRPFLLSRYVHVCVRERPIMGVVLCSDTTVTIWYIYRISLHVIFVAIQKS